MHQDTNGITPVTTITSSQLERMLAMVSSLQVLLLSCTPSSRKAKKYD
jgi:hypothetical protein